MTEKQPKALLTEIKYSANRLEHWQATHAIDTNAITDAMHLLRRVGVRIAELDLVITATHKAKGRYHSQLAMCDLYDAVGLPNVRPGDDKLAQPAEPVSDKSNPPGFEGIAEPVALTDGAAYRAMMSAYSLCPTEMSHPKRMRWMAQKVEEAINQAQPAELSMLRELDALRADAAQYRWLLANSERWSWDPSRYSKNLVSGFAANGTAYLGFGFAQAIDEAIAQQAAPNQGATD